MTPVFADTSALYALLVSTDSNHRRARKAFDGLRAREAPLLSTSYVLVEAYALVGRRVGLEAVARFRAEFAPLLQVVWVDGGLHEAGLDLLLERRWADLSLVDAVSFVVMTKSGTGEAFAYDPHFEREGFTILG